ncbi:MAG: DNA-directed RNA polymerase subunit delta [Firmicutes bacterium]|nr:DNA-directed RNA polymerase subunit delta [Bacillota bacterium]
MASAGRDKSAFEVHDTPLVDLAYELLSASNEPFYYRELLDRVADSRQATGEERLDLLARLYTDINIDGRFVMIGDNNWGLRRWYPMEKTTDRNPGKRFHRKEESLFDDEDVELEEEVLLEEEEPLFVVRSDDEDPAFADEDDDAEHGLTFVEEDAEDDSGDHEFVADDDDGDAEDSDDF